MFEIENIFLDKINSTQSWTKKNYLSFDPNIITCVIANEQTAAIGKFNRKWISPKDLCIASTFYFQLPIKTKDITTLSMLLCYSLSELLTQKNLSPQIKWPNDIMLSNKKLSGVLCEIIFIKDIIHVFLGIGININMDEKDLSEIDQKATSLKIQTNKFWDKNKLLEELQSQFIKNLSLFLEKDFSSFSEKINPLLFDKNKNISISDGKHHYEGILDSITPSGELNIKLKNNEIKIISSGDILKNKN
jgi:BirA family biotin operon repressor/biotin-[acetyl-CoA-carboxylase] ligase